MPSREHQGFVGIIHGGSISLPRDVQSQEVLWELVAGELLDIESG